MKLDTPSKVLAALMWASVIIEAWLLIIRRVPSDLVSWGFFVFFLLVAVVAPITSPSK